jgi:hypothetical protein
MMYMDQHIVDPDARRSPAGPPIDTSDSVAGSSFSSGTADVLLPRASIAAVSTRLRCDGPGGGNRC